MDTASEMQGGIRDTSKQRYILRCNSAISSVGKPSEPDFEAGKAELGGPDV